MEIQDVDGITKDLNAQHLLAQFTVCDSMRQSARNENEQKKQQGFHVAHFLMMPHRD